MTSARRPKPLPDSTPADVTSEAAVEPADWLKPVELIELLQRRAEKRKHIEAPTSSPFYDAEFVAENRKKISRKRNYRKPDQSSSGS